MQMDAEQVILTRGLLKTGEILTTPEGCDGYYQAGWWKGLKIEDNKIRLIAKTINGDDVIIDLATDLMWAADGSAAGCNNEATDNWPNSIVYANALDFAGFTDWRLPNIRELQSIVDYGLGISAIKEPPFSHTFAGYYWSSTSYVITPTTAFVVDFTNGGITAPIKTLTQARLRCVRGGL